MHINRRALGDEYNETLTRQLANIGLRNTHGSLGIDESIFIQVIKHCDVVAYT